MSNFKILNGYNVKDETAREDIATLNNQINNESTGIVGEIADIEEDITSIENRVEDLETSNVYSTSETVIGTWINGKPLYSKTYVTNEVIHTYQTDDDILEVPLGNIDADEIFIDKAFMHDERLGITVLMNCYEAPDYMADNWHAGININKTDGCIKIVSINGGAAADWTKVIVVNYTKTTDIVE